MNFSDKPVALFGAQKLCAQDSPRYAALCAEHGTPSRDATIACGILSRHDMTSDPALLRVRFDALCSHDITYVSIIQTVRAANKREFPLKYILTNCHNSLCAVGGTINEDDHAFGLSAAKKYGAEFVPPHLAVIHSYLRECEAAPGKMLLGSDSHTRYGAFGTLGVGEGGPELVKQLLGLTWDIPRPEVICVYLTGAPRHGVGPQDVALALIRAVFDSGFAKNKILEFVGPGVANLSMEYRSGIDVMTTETACLSSVWVTDAKTRAALEQYGRGDAYTPLSPGNAALYDGAVELDLSEIVPMIALPFHPSNAYPIAEFLENAPALIQKTEEDAKERLGDKVSGLGLAEKLRAGGFYCDQAIVAGCAGGSFENIALCANILEGAAANSLPVSVYPGSMPIALDLARKGVAAHLMQNGVVIKTAFCGPCFGAGDTPQNRGFSIRHTTRNFPLREGAKPAEGQVAAVALMDARSIAATAAAGGKLTPADCVDYSEEIPAFDFDAAAYNKKVYRGFGRPQPKTPLVIGPNITDWPPMRPLTDDLLLCIASVITDPVTTTDELIPSGETSSLRSNPERLSRFTLSRKDPSYVERALRLREAEYARRAGKDASQSLPDLTQIWKLCAQIKPSFSPENTGLGTAIFANRPGDGSAREQAASCQKVLCGEANFALQYATKRYRSNLINWGMLPLLVAENCFEIGDFVFFPDLYDAIARGGDEICFYILRGGKSLPKTARLGALSEEEREILLAGCLTNFCRK